MAARHLAAVPRPATRKKVDSIIRVTLSRDFRVVWENSVGTDALVRPQRDSAAGKNSFGISIPASVGRDALVPPTINRTPLSFRALAEKYPAEETRINVHEYPQDSPARAPRREIPCSRNENNRTRINIKKCRQSPKRPFPLPARNIVASPLWLKTVTCGLFLRHFVPPRRASAIPTVTPFPRNDRLLGRVGRFIRINIIKPSAHPYRLVIASEAWQSRGNEMPPTCPRGLRAPRRFTAEKSPAEETRTNVYEYPKHSPARALRRASPLARGGSPPRNPPRKKREQSYTLCGGPRANRPT